MVTRLDLDNLDVARAFFDNLLCRVQILDDGVDLTIDADEECLLVASWYYKVRVQGIITYMFWYT